MLDPSIDSNDGRSTDMPEELPIIRMETAKGTMEIELFEDEIQCDSRIRLLAATDPQIEMILAELKTAG